MKKLIKLFLYLNLFLYLISCGKISPQGSVETKDVEVSDFKNLNLKGKFRIFFVRASKNFVEVETYPNFYKNLEIEVGDNTLNILENRETKGLGFYNITVYSKNSLDKVSIADSVEMNISSQIKTEKFHLNLKKSAKFIGSINSRSADVEMSDHSLANFNGFTDDVSIKLKDTASIIAPYWKIKSLKIEARNGSYAEVDVEDFIKGNIQNSAKFLYYNDPIRAFKIEKTADVQNKKLE